MQHRPRAPRGVRALAVALAVTLLPALAAGLTGCAAAPPGPADTASGPVRIVASTSVYGDIAARIGGGHVSVTSIIDDPSRDPHEYQADGQNELSVAKAAIVIENGGGYDDFMDALLAAAKNDDVVVLNAARIAGHASSALSGDVNEHLWYDLATVRRVADRLVSALALAQPGSAPAFESNGAAFDADIARLQHREASLKKTYAGTPVGITEPVPLYVLDAIGLRNRTPKQFSTAVEEGRDVPPTVLRATLELYRRQKVALLAYNPQTSGPQAAAVLRAARAAGIPAVPFAEVLPQGAHYVPWLAATLDRVEKALQKGRQR